MNIPPIFGRKLLFSSEIKTPDERRVKEIATAIVQHNTGEIKTLFDDY